MTSLLQTEGPLNIIRLYGELYADKFCKVDIFMHPRSKIGGHIVFVLSVIVSFCQNLQYDIL